MEKTKIFLREKGLIEEGGHDLIIIREDGKECSLLELLEEYEHWVGYYPGSN